MADEIENPTRVSNSFKVPKRNLNIGGIDKKNRPFNARFNRPIKKSEELSKLMINGIIKSVELGSKNCFFVNHDITCPKGVPPLGKCKHTINGKL